MEKKRPIEKRECLDGTALTKLREYYGEEYDIVIPYEGITAIDIEFLCQLDISIKLDESRKEVTLRWLIRKMSSNLTILRWSKIDGLKKMNMKTTIKDEIRRYISSHADEVFTPKHISTALGIKMPNQKMASILEDMRDEIFMLRLDPYNVYYGTRKSISRLNKLYREKQDGQSSCA